MTLDNITGHCIVDQSVLRDILMDRWTFNADKSETPKTSFESSERSQFSIETPSPPRLPIRRLHLSL